VRTPVYRRLPDLRVLCRGFKGFRKGENKTGRIHEELLKCARRLQTSNWIAFYSMRQVADFFGVSVPTVASVFRRLQNDRVLVCSRSSRTSLCPRKARTARAQVRGVVVIPVWTPGFVVLAEFRVFHMELERALRRRDFVPEILFYRHGEETDPEFARRINRYRPDFVVWYAPARSDYQTVRIIMDSGVRVVAIAGAPFDCPAASYLLNQSNAVDEAMAAWRERGISGVVLPGIRPGSSESDVAIVESAARKAGLCCSCCELAGSSKAEELDGMRVLARRMNAGIMLLSRFHFINLCRQWPMEISAIIRDIPSLTLGGLYIPQSHLRDVFMDEIRFDLSRMARRVASDVSGNLVPDPSAPHIFYAGFWPGVSAASVASTSLSV